MANGDMLHGATGTLDRAASMAATVCTNIEGHRAGMQPMVEALRGQWEGSAYRAFETAHRSWEQGITRLTAALNNLGDNTRFSANTYLATDETNAAGLNAVQSHSPFNGALSV
jgi:ESAT-6 family protein